jgi:hypothetical protein
MSTHHMYPTPITDEMAERCAFQDNWKAFHNMKNLAEELELELSDALQELAEARAKLASLT